ncbi:signal peptidase II [Phycicoccus sp. Root101]|uniref:signal peptidase II n=1 Tax=Phycicoccus sp. Root101 TaxID=1736421 RepID=UPI000702A302|nr:signal peptidase II [Phycicoccus sp. Root101]KQU67378.1 hypothetical protein ASC58_12390 [Phycicoccus sp. Root101]
MSATEAGAVQQQGRRPAARRAAVLAIATAVAAVDLSLKAWARGGLPAGGFEAGPVDLRLAYNPGVAFSVAAEAPPSVVIAGTGLVTAGVAALVWMGAPTATRLRLAAFAAVLGGAVANLTDRAGDGVVTDYLHSGWWPTFNLADTAIVTGAILLVLSSIGPSRAAGKHEARR